MNKFNMNGVLTLEEKLTPESVGRIARAINDCLGKGQKFSTFMVKERDKFFPATAHGLTLKGQVEINKLSDRFTVGGKPVPELVIRYSIDDRGITGYGDYSLGVIENPEIANTVCITTREIVIFSDDDSGVTWMRIDF